MVPEISSIFAETGKGRMNSSRILAVTDRMKAVKCTRESGVCAEKWHIAGIFDFSAPELHRGAVKPVRE
jgi:hypothetical protein